MMRLSRPSALSPSCLAPWHARRTFTRVCNGRGACVCWEELGPHPPCQYSPRHAVCTAVELRVRRDGRSGEMSLGGCAANEAHVWQHTQTRPTPGHHHTRPRVARWRPNPNPLEPAL
jgi:hypothetical protein